MQTPQTRARVLCLGNDILADDALGFRVAERLHALGLEGIEIVCTSAAGFDLLDSVQEAGKLIVVDSIQTGRAEPGTVYQVREHDVAGPPGDSPHRIGLFEVLATGRKLGLAVPDDVVIIVVETADVFTVGGQMHPAVQAAVPEVVNLVLRLAE